MPRFLFSLLVLLSALAPWPAAAEDDPAWITFAGGQGPGSGRHIVFVSGDEEYRSEEALPQLAKILSQRHGFRTTVLFSLDPDGTINPNNQENIPGLEALESADLLVLFTRFRNLPDEQMRHIVDYIESGRPVIGLRTATHAFNMPADSTFGRYGWQSKQWDGGFGRQVLGETWINHHGQHGSQSTRGILAPQAANHPIVSGIADGDIWGPTDVYGVRLPLPGDSQPLILGQVLSGMEPTDEPVTGKQNDPLMPIAWVKTYTTPTGKTARVFTTTMGASQDLQSAGLRRLLVNAAYWAVGLESEITPDANVDIVGSYEATPFGFGTFQKNRRPSDYGQLD